MSELEEKDNESLDNLDKEKIEKLSEELIQVFDYENMNKTSLTQKEDLVKKVLQPLIHLASICDGYVSQLRPICVGIVTVRDIVIF